MDRNPNRLIYAGAAGWSLASALKIHARIREYLPNAELHVYSSGIVAKPNTDIPQALYASQKLQERTNAQLKGPGVTHVSDFDGAALGAAMASAGLWLAPMHLTEVDICGARLAQKHGAIPIFCPVGPLGAEVFAGIPIWGVPYQESYPRCKFVYEALKILGNAEGQEAIRQPMMALAAERYAGLSLTPERMLDIVREASKIQGWMSHAELAWLAETAATVRSIVEIGCWKGRSTFALASACSGVVAAVDHWQGGKDEPEHIRKECELNDMYGQFSRNVERFLKSNGYGARVLPFVMPSLEAAAQMGASDLVFIDGGHEYSEVRDDIRAWLPKAKKILAGHDYDWRSVREAVRDELGTVEQGPGAIWIYRIPQDEGGGVLDTERAMANAAD